MTPLVKPYLDEMKRISDEKMSKIIDHSRREAKKRSKVADRVKDYVVRAMKRNFGRKLTADEIKFINEKLG